MKKWSLVLVAMLGIAAVHADYPEKAGALSGKVILQNTNGYFVLSDGSCWKAIGFSKRWRSLREWWNNVSLAPKNYECAPKDWFLGAQIEAYSKYENLNVNEADASNQEALQQCSHLLVNKGTGQVLFAVAFDPASCISYLFADARDEGYQDGYAQGRLSSYQNATDIYNSAYEEGYQAALRDNE